MKIGPEQNVQMPMKTVISLIVMVSLGTFGYFQIQEKLNQHDTLLQMHTKDLDQNSEFRIKYPRGELGQSSGESRAFHVSGAHGWTNNKDGRPYGKHDVKFR